MSASPNLAIPHVVSNQNSKEVTINEAVDALDRALNDAVDLDCAAGDTTIAAADFAANARFRLTGTPAAAFNLTVPASKRLFVVANEAGQVATVTTGAGATVAVAAGERAVLYGDGAGVLQAAEVAGAKPIDVGFFFGGTPTASQTVKFIATRAFTLPAALAGSQGHAGTATTAQADFDIRKNGGSIGTASFAASSSAATFTFASAVSFAAGDRLEVTAPASSDATLADVAVTLTGIRS
jgi:hypothetical protein